MAAEVRRFLPAVVPADRHEHRGPPPRHEGEHHRRAPGIHPGEDRRPLHHQDRAGMPGHHRPPEGRALPVESPGHLRLYTALDVEGEQCPPGHRLRPRPSEDLNVLGTAQLGHHRGRARDSEGDRHRCDGPCGRVCHGHLHRVRPDEGGQGEQADDRGATIVSIATTLPELIVSIIAAIEGHGLLVAGEEALALSSVDMAIGNAIGSVNANSGLIMAISLIFMPAVIKRKEFWVKPVLLMATIVLLFLASLSGELTPVGAIFVLLMLVVFFVENTISAKRQMGLQQEVKEDEVNEASEEQEEPKGFFKKLAVKYEIPTNIIMFILGAAGIVLGARLLVDKGTQIAIMLNVPTKIIALTMVAIGTSLPELVTTISAIVKKQSDLSVGNIFGANLIDMALILPVCSFIFGAGLPVNNNVLYLDMAFAFGLSAIAIVPTLIRGKFSRIQGFALFATYITYIVLSSILHL